MNVSNILFVTSGTGVPYPPLEQAVCEAFRKNGAVVTSISPQELNSQTNIREYDLLLVFHGVNLELSDLYFIAGCGIPTAIWLTDDPYYTDITKFLSFFFRYVFTIDESCISLYRDAGCKQVYHLPLVRIRPCSAQ